MESSTSEASGSISPLSAMGALMDSAPELHVSADEIERLLVEGKVVRAAGTFMPLSEEMLTRALELPAVAAASAPSMSQGDDGDGTMNSEEVMQILQKPEASAGSADDADLWRSVCMSGERLHLHSPSTPVRLWRSVCMSGERLHSLSPSTPAGGFGTSPAKQ